MMNKLVLVIEDDENDREIYGKLLWYNGFDVIFAVDADMGYWLAREAEPDLVVLDLGLPDMDGLELCRRLASEPGTASIPVVILSARPAMDYSEPAKRAGCALYIEKPASPLDVMHEIERIIGRPETAEAHGTHSGREAFTPRPA